MAELDKLIAALKERLEDVAAAQDASMLFEAGAQEEARQLVAMLRENDRDLQARYLLGWIHWHRYQSLPKDNGGPDLEAAIAMLTPCFVADMQDLPAALQPMLAEHAVPDAISLTTNALDSLQILV